MTPEQFINYIGDACGRICPVYNLPASVCIAQAALESGWGKYVIGHYNYFGRKAVSTDSDYVVKTTSEYIDGEYVTIEDKFKSYTSLEDAIEDWCILMREEPVYQDAVNDWDNSFDLTTFVTEMASHYATDPDYANKILSTINANDLTAYDAWDVTTDE